MPVIIDGTLGVNAAAITTTNWTPTNITTGGNTTLGDASGDTVTVNAGNTTFAASGARIKGDFSNATLANQLLFQTSTTNGSTQLRAIPDGTGTQTGFFFYDNPDTLNNAWAAIRLVSGTDARIQSGQTGTGSYLPLTFYNGGAERVRIATDGKVGINTSAPETSLQVNGGLTLGTTGSTGTVMRFGTDGANGAIIRADRSDASGVRYLAFGIDYNERMRIDTAGKLLINTTSSTNSISTDKLIVRGDTNGVDLGGSASTGSVRVRGSDAGAALVDFTKLSTNPDASPYFQGRIFYQLGSDYMSFHTASSERLRIDSSGRTMIGMNNGQSTFNAYNANGGAPATSGSTDTTTVASLINGVVGLDFGHYTSGTAWVQNRTFNNYATNYDLALQPNGGNVGIGTSGQSAKLSVYGSSGRFSELLGNTMQVRIAASEGGWNSLIGFANNAGTFLGGILGNGAGQTITDIRLGTSASPSTIIIDSANTVTTNKIKEYTTTFYIQGYTAQSWDIPIPDCSANGNFIEVVAGYNHYAGPSYGAWLRTMVSYRSASNLSIYQDDIKNWSSGGGGSWSVSVPNGTTLRITKNAGSYSGGGYGYITVTFNSMA